MCRFVRLAAISWQLTCNGAYDTEWSSGHNRSQQWALPCMIQTVKEGSTVSIKPRGWMDGALSFMTDAIKQGRKEAQLWAVWLECCVITLIDH